MTRSSTTRPVIRADEASSSGGTSISGFVPLSMVGLAAIAAVAIGRSRTDQTAWPPVLHPASLREWWTARDPLDAAAGVAAMLCAVALVYLCLVGALRVWSLRSGRTRLSRVTARLLPRVVVVMTATLLTTTTAAHAATASADDTSADSGTHDRSVPRMELVPTPDVPTTRSTSTVRASSTTTTGSSTTTTTLAAPPDPPPPAVDVVSTTVDPATTGPTAAAPSSPDTIDPATVAAGSPGVEARTSLPWASADTEPGAAVGGASSPVAQSAPSAPSAPIVPPAPGAVVHTYVVQFGDHLWAIAERVVGERAGAAPDERQIVAYWSALIDANRDRLVDADNPDLILAGQELLLPTA